MKWYKLYKKYGNKIQKREELRIDKNYPLTKSEADSLAIAVIEKLKKATP